MRPARRWRGGGDQSAMLRLALILGHQLQQMPHKPPITLGLSAVMVAIFMGFVDAVPSVRRACLQPHAILEGALTLDVVMQQQGQWSRLFWSALLHSDDTHLMLNVSSFLWKGAILEPQLGSDRYAALLLELLVLSHGMILPVTKAVAMVAPSYSDLYYRDCAIGFSAVLFALKVVLNARSPTYSSVFGVSVPTKYLCWAELLLAQVLTPHASLVGHLSGILAGLLHVYVLQAALPGGRGQSGAGWLSRWMRTLRNWRRPFQGNASYAVRRPDRGDGSRQPHHDAVEPAMSSSTSALSPEALRLQRQLYYEEVTRRPSFSAASDPFHDDGTGRQARGQLRTPPAVQNSLQGARRRRRATQGRQRLLSPGMLLALVAVTAVTAWATNPNAQELTELLTAMAERGFGSVPGAVIGAAVWLQSKAGFGPRIRSLGLFSHASLHGMWFIGAFGRWMGPFPLPATALAVWRLSPVRSMLRQLGRAVLKDSMVMPHPLIMIVAALLVLGFIARRALPARTVVQHLEVSSDSISRPWTLLTGLAAETAPGLVRDVAVLIINGPAALDALGPVAFLILYFAGNVASYAALLLWKGGLHSVSRRSRPRRTELWHACGGAAASWTLLACVLTTKAVRTWSAASRSAGTSSKAAAGTPWLWWWQLLLPPSVIKPVAGDGWLPVLSWSAALSWKDLAAMLVALADLALTIVSMSRVALLLRTVGIFTGVAAGVLIAAHA